MKKVFSLIFVVCCIILATGVAAEADSGSCGDAAYWETDAENKVLTISGSGKMKDYSAPVYVPWHKYKDTVEKIIVEEGIEYIGNDCFYNMHKAKEISFPHSLNKTANDSLTYLDSLEAVFYYGTEEEWSNIFFNGNHINDELVYCMRDGGYAGDSLKWVIEYDGVLTIFGKGDMTEFTQCNLVPWYSYAGSVKEIHIKSGVTSISSHAFEGNYNPEHIYYYNTPESWETVKKGSYNTLLEGVEYIWACGKTSDKFNWILYADGTLCIDGEGPMKEFYSEKPAWSAQKSRIKSVKLSEGITKIGAEAFYEHSELSEISIPSTVVEIGKSAFRGCSVLNEVIFPENLKTIGEKAFADCKNLKAIMLFNKIENIGDGAFPAYKSGSNSNMYYYCGTEEEWSRVTVGESNTLLTNYLRFTRGSGKCGEEIRWALGIDGSLFITGSGKMQDYNSFDEVPWMKWSTEIKTVYIQPNVTGIGNNCFKNTQNLEKVFFNGAAELWNNITIGENNECLTKAKRYGIKEMGEVGENITWILDHDGVLFLEGEGVMSDFDNYSSQPWHDYENEIKKVVVGEGITKTGQNAFASMSKLREVILPESLTEIGERTFADDIRIYRITLPSNLKTIGKSAFSSAYNLNYIVIPKSVTEIQESAFNYCIRLDSVYYKGVYNDWSKISIGPDNTELTNATRYYCVDCTSASDSTQWALVNGGKLYILGSGKMENYLVESPWYDYRDTIKSVSISSEITSIGDRAFSGLSNVSDIQVPENVTYVGKNAFEGCIGLKELVFSPALTEVGDEAMKDCINLETVLIYSPKKIGEGALSGCESLKKFYYAGTAEDFMNVEIGGNNRPLEKCGVTGVMAMGKCGKDAIWLLGYNETLAITGSGAVDGYTAYEKAPWMEYNDLIKHIVVREGITSIGERVFLGCTNALTLSISPTVTSIGEKFAYECSSLEHVVIPGSIKTVPYNAFYGCTSLRYVALEDGVETLGRYAFNKCTSLEAVFMPVSLTKIEEGAFNNCTSLKYIYYAGDKTDLDSMDISSSANSPLSTVSVYPEYELYLGDYGYRVTDYTIRGSVLNVQCKILNNSSSKINVKAIAGVYNADGILKGAATKSVSVYKGASKQSTVQIKNYTPEEGDYIKLFVWKSTKTMEADYFPAVRMIK